MSFLGVRARRGRGRLALVGGLVLVAACGGRAVDTPDGDGPRRRGGRLPDPGGAPGGIAGGWHGGSAQGGSAQGGRRVGTGGPLAGGGWTGWFGGGTRGEVSEVPPLETFVGHYDLFAAPPDFDCEGLDGAVHLSLRLGDSGLEARVFQPFEWNGWPDSVEIDTTAG